MSQRRSGNPPGWVRSGRFLPTALVAVGVLLARGRGLSAGELEPQAFLQTYRAAIAAQLAQQDHGQLEGDLHRTMTRATEPTPFRDETTHLSFGGRGEQHLFAYSLTKPTSIDRRFVFRVGKVSFGMRRSDRNNAYALEFINELPSGLLLQELLLAPAARSIEDQLLEPLVKSPTFAFRRVDQTVVAGRPIVHAEFDYQPPDRKTAYNFVGTIDLDPANLYAITRYNVTSQIAGLPESERLVRELTGTVEYAEEEGCHLLPRRVQRQSLGLHLGKLKLKIDEEFTATRISREPVAERELTPEFYGLASLDAPAASSNHLAWWAFGAAFVALGITVILRRLGR